MPINEAKKELKKNKSDYSDISFGNGVKWRIFKQNFTVINEQLHGLMLVPKGALFGLDHESAKVYLQNSKLFFESKDYEVFWEPDNWNIPVFFEATNKYGLLMNDAEKTIMIELRPVEISAGSYTVNLGVSNYDAFLKYMQAKEKAIKKVQDKTGFW